MNRPARKPHAVRVLAPTTTHKVRFGKQSRTADHHAEEKPIGRVPRVARLLALAHKIDRLIRSGELKNWAEAARLIGLSRARMTQVANLLLLAPEIQDGILKFALVQNGDDPITEHHLQTIEAMIDWHEQKRAWHSLQTRSRSAGSTL